MAVWLDVVNAMAVLRAEVVTLTTAVQTLYNQNAALKAKIVTLEAQIAAQPPGGPTPQEMQTMTDSMVAAIGDVTNAANSVVAIASGPIP